MRAACSYVRLTIAKMARCCVGAVVEPRELEQRRDEVGREHRALEPGVELWKLSRLRIAPHWILVVTLPERLRLTIGSSAPSLSMRWQLAASNARLYSAAAASPLTMVSDSCRRSAMSAGMSSAASMRASSVRVMFHTRPHTHTHTHTAPGAAVAASSRSHSVTSACCAPRTSISMTNAACTDRLYIASAHQLPVTASSRAPVAASFTTASSAPSLIMPSTALGCWKSVQSVCAHTWFVGASFEMRLTSALTASVSTVFSMSSCSCPAMHSCRSAAAHIGPVATSSKPLRAIATIAEMAPCWMIFSQHETSIASRVIAIAHSCFISSSSVAAILSSTGITRCPVIFEREREQPLRLLSVLAHSRSVSSARPSGLASGVGARR